MTQRDLMVGVRRIRLTNLRANVCEKKMCEGDVRTECRQILLETFLSFLCVVRRRNCLLMMCGGRKSA